MKIVITSMVWKREKLFHIWADGVKRIIDTFQECEFKVLVAGSEGDKSKAMVVSHGFDYIETPNEPLYLKANIRLEACKKYKADYILFLPSDDFINNKTFSFILDKMKQGYDEIAPMDLFIYDSEHKRMIYSCGYTNHRRGERLAIGRAVKSNVLAQLNWNLWDTLDSGLDMCAVRRLNRVVKSPYYFWLSKENLFILDVKTPDNLSRLPKHYMQDNHQIISHEYLKNIREGDKILAL